MECFGVPGGVWFEGDGDGSNCLCIYLSHLRVLRNLLEVRVLGHCSSPVDHLTTVLVVPRSAQLATEALKAMTILIFTLSVSTLMGFNINASSSG